MHPLSTCSITARRLLEHRQSVWMPPHQGYWCPYLHDPIFTLNTLSAATLPIYHGSVQALNNAGLHTSGLVLQDWTQNWTDYTHKY